MFDFTQPFCRMELFNALFTHIILLAYSPMIFHCIPLMCPDFTYSPIIILIILTILIIHSHPHRPSYPTRIE